MTNQIVLNAENLPTGFEWQIVNYYTPTGIKKLPGLKFKDFEMAVGKGSMDGFNLFELHRQERVIMAFCKVGIVK